MQLRRPSVTIAADSDEAAAVASRRKALNLVSSNKWWVGGAHLPFPGLGHLRRDPDRYTCLHAGRSELARKAMSEHLAAGAAPLINHLIEHGVVEPS